MATYNIKTTKKCAFCKYWYDPAWTALKPEAPKGNLWSYAMNVKKMCIKKGVEMSSDAFCGQYQCKLTEFFN